MQTKKKQQARGNSPACSSSVPTHHALFKHLVKCCLKFSFFMGFVTQPCNLHAFYVWKNPGRVSHTPWRAKKLPVQDIQIKTEFFISFGSEFLLFLKKEKEKLQLHFLFYRQCSMSKNVVSPNQYGSFMIWFTLFVYLVDYFLKAKNPGRNFLQWYYATIFIYVIFLNIIIIFWGASSS